MPETLTRVTGPVVLPDGTRPNNGQMRFTLQGWDKIEGVTIAPGPIVAAVGVDGAFEVELNSSVLADRGVVYSVELSYWADGAPRSVGFPPIGVPAVGPVALATLLANPATTPTPPEALAQCIAAMETAVDAAARAVAAAGIPNDAAIFASTAAGLAGTDLGDFFGVVVGDEIVWYRHDAGPVATEVARYATAASVDALRVRAELQDVSGPFLVAALDLDGWALRVDWTEGDQFLPDLSGVAAAVTPIAGAELDADGWALPGRLQWNTGEYWPEDLVQPAASPLGDLIVNIGYGQSVSTGSGQGDLSTDTIAGLNMFSEGDFLADAVWNAPPAFDTVVPHVATAGREPWARGIAESAAQFLQTLRGVDIKSGGGVLSVTAARGEQSVLDLSEGGAYFGRLPLFLQAAADHAAASGRAAFVGPLPYVQGEADIAAGTALMQYAQQLETGIRVPFEQAVRDVIDPQYRCLMLLTQVASAAYYNRTDHAVPLAQLRLCIERPDRYAFAGAMYQYLYGGLGGAGSHLNGAVENKWAAAMMGRAWAYAVAGLPVPFIKPLRAAKRGARAVVMEFDVPTAPLVLDAVAVSDPGNFGFKLFRADTGAEITLASVAVVGGTAVKLTVAADLPAVHLRVAYAQHGGALDDDDADSFGSDAGRLTGNRGCLRDSTAETFTIGAETKPLWHWAPICELTTGA